MGGVLILLGALLLAGVVLKLLDMRHARSNPTPAAEAVPVDDDHDNAEGCCGLHEVCEKRLPASRADLYYDDEELDRWLGTPADAYPEEGVEEFRDVMLTLRPAEAAAWSDALQRRGIALPAELRDELLLIVADAAQ